MRLSGHLAVGADGVAFTGPAEIKANDPKALAAWLEGRGEAAQGDLRPLRLRGDVTLGSDKIAVERLSAEFDRKTVTGRLAYVFAAAGGPGASSMPRSTRPNSTSTPRSASARRCSPAPRSSGRTT